MVSQQGLLWVHAGRSTCIWSTAVIFLDLTCQLLPCCIPVSNRKQHDDYRNLSNLLPRKWDVTYTTKKPAFTFFLLGTNGILSQLTHCSTPVQLSRGWCSKWLTDFTCCRWCCIRLHTERLLSLSTRDADLAQAYSQRYLFVSVCNISGAPGWTVPSQICANSFFLYQVADRFRVPGLGNYYQNDIWKRKKPQKNVCVRVANLLRNGRSIKNIKSYSDNF